MMNRYKLFYVAALTASLIAFLSVSTNSQAQQADQQVDARGEEHFEAGWEDTPEDPVARANLPTDPAPGTGIGDDGQRMVIGKVISIHDLTLKGASDPHRLVRIENQQGQQMVVNIGIVNANLNVEPGDRLVAVGKSARINDKPVLFAKYAGELASVGAQ